MGKPGVQTPLQFLRGVWVPFAPTPPPPPSPGYATDLALPQVLLEYISSHINLCESGYVYPGLELLSFTV